MAVPAPHPWRTEGEGLDEVARRALLAFVSAPQVLLDSGVGGAGVDEGQARTNAFTEKVGHPRCQTGAGMPNMQFISENDFVKHFHRLFLNKNKALQTKRIRI